MARVSKRLSHATVAAWREAARIERMLQLGGFADLYVHIAWITDVDWRFRLSGSVDRIAAARSALPEVSAVIGGGTAAE